VGFKSLKSKARDGDAPIAKICRSFLEPGVGVHVWRLCTAFAKSSRTPKRCQEILTPLLVPKRLLNYNGAEIETRVWEY